MFSIVRNTDVKERSSQAVVVAVSSEAVFNTDTPKPDPAAPELLDKGPAFSFIKAVQQVNKKLLDINPAETLLFDVILLLNDNKDTSSKIIASVKHYGLAVSRFCFCNKNSNIESLKSSDANLFLSTDRNDVFEALQQGVPSALLYPQQTSQLQTSQLQTSELQTSQLQTSEQKLTVIFSGDALGCSMDDLSSLTEQSFTEAQLLAFTAAKDTVKQFAVQMGEMRSRFALAGFPLAGCPLRAGLVTAWGTREVCARALLTLRGWGLLVDEALCLAGASPSPFLHLLQPHILCVDGLTLTPGGAKPGGEMD